MQSGPPVAGSFSPVEPLCIRLPARLVLCSGECMLSLRTVWNFGSWLLWLSVPALLSRMAWLLVCTRLRTALNITDP